MAKMSAVNAVTVCFCIRHKILEVLMLLLDPFRVVLQT